MWRSWAGIVVMPVGRIAKLSKKTLEAAYGREINIKFSGNSSVGHSRSQHANCMLPQLEMSVTLCCVTKRHILVVFYCPPHKVHLCNDHAVQSAFYMPHPLLVECNERQVV